MKVVKSLALAGLVGLSSLYGTDFGVDTTHSDVAFKVKHLMISSVKGSFENFSGSFSIDEKQKKFTSIEGEVNVASLSTKDTKRDNDLKSTYFFDAKKYPTIKLKLLEHNGESAKVELTIKDVTKVVQMKLKEVSDVIIDPWGQSRMAFELHGSINRHDFNIKFNQLLETGGVVVGDKVKIDISIEGTQKKEIK